MPLQVVQENTALVLRAKRSFYDRYGKTNRRAGEQWLFKGPNTYYPQVEVEEVRTQVAVLLKPDHGTFETFSGSYFGCSTFG
jgi:major vault protein